MRYDYILIWGNGIQYIPNIVGMIRNHANFEIVRMKRLKFENMEQFVKDVYASDTAPWIHLKAKSRYLMESLFHAVFILMINKEPNEQQKGPRRNHIECRKMTALKIQIRNAFNPRFSDPTQGRPPLDLGVTHQHCVHGSDYESQTEHMLMIVGWKNLDFHRRNNHLEYFFPYHLTGVNNPKLETKCVDDLRVGLVGQGRVKVENTPHYQYVCGITQAYEDYFSQHFGLALCEDHFPKAFDRMIRGFELNKVMWDGRKSRIIIRGNNVLDGGHRLAICKALGIQEVECIQLETT